MPQYKQTHTKEQSSRLTRICFVISRIKVIVNRALWICFSLSLIAAHPRRLHMFAVGNDVELLLAEQQKWSCLQALFTVRRRVCVWRCLRNIYKLSRNFSFACLHENCFDDGGKLLFVSFETKWMFVIGRHQCVAAMKKSPICFHCLFSCVSSDIFISASSAPPLRLAKTNMERIKVCGC